MINHHASCLCQVSHLRKDVSVQTFLSDWSVLGVVITQPELEVSLVVGGELHLDVDGLSLGEVGGYHPNPIFSSKLLRPRLREIIGITTDTTQTLIVGPLPSISTTVSLMVINISRSGEAVPPHGGPAGGVS